MKTATATMNVRGFAKVNHYLDFMEHIQALVLDYITFHGLPERMKKKIVKGLKTGTALGTIIKPKNRVIHGVSCDEHLEVWVMPITILNETFFAIKTPDEMYIQKNPLPLKELKDLA